MMSEFLDAAYTSLPLDLMRLYRLHHRSHGRFPRLVRQPAFTDRIAYRKIFPQPIFGQLTDKVAVRDFVRERLGEDYLVPIYATTSDMETFRFEELPQSFVMKANHGCGWNALVPDKDKADLDELRRKASGWLRQNFYRLTRERQYRYIPPQILFEKLLSEDGRTPRDYKVNCFRKDGKLTQIFEVHSERFTDHRVNYFTADWTPIDLTWGASQLPWDQVQPPAQLGELLSVAEQLSRGFNFVRVDLYAVRDRVYFGEMTFTPGGGILKFNPPELDEYWGSLFEPDWRAPSEDILMESRGSVRPVPRHNGQAARPRELLDAVSRG